MKNNDVFTKVLNLLKKEEIKIFFCYSEDMRVDIETLIDKLTERNKHAYRSFLPNRWDDSVMTSYHNTDGEVQDGFDKEIMKSSYAVFLFDNEFKKGTIHEWELCMSNKKKKPIILLGLKQTKYSKYTIAQKRKILKSANKVRDYVYGDIEEFVQFVQDVLEERHCQRMKKAESMIIRYGSDFSINDKTVIETKVSEIERRVNLSDQMSKSIEVIKNAMGIKDSNRVLEATRFNKRKGIIFRREEQAKKVSNKHIRFTDVSKIG